MDEKILKGAEAAHYDLQQGMYFSGRKKIAGATLLWSNKVKDSYWNFATQIDVSVEKVQDLIKKVVQFYRTKNRHPTIYVTPFTNPKNLPELLGKHGFTSQLKDAWMFYKGDAPKIAMPRGLTIKRVESQTDMKTFLGVFNNAYGGATSEDPYGAIPPEYNETLATSFKENDKRIFHYLGLLNGEPVSIATLIRDEKYAGIYNVGTVANKRKLGLGTALTMYCAAEAIKNGIETVFLQTEKGTYNEKYYNKLGFSTKFIGEGFVLNSAGA